MTFRLQQISHFCSIKFFRRIHIRQQSEFLFYRFKSATVCPGSLRLWGSLSSSQLQHLLAAPGSVLGLHHYLGLAYSPLKRKDEEREVGGREVIKP